VRFLIDGLESGGGFSLVEHPMSARALAAPMHRHSREDEYSYIVEGRVGALLGPDVVFGNPGDLIFKPRGQWHTFWNTGDEPARLLEIISPAGFEQYFAELVELGGSTALEPQERAALGRGTASRSTRRASPSWSAASGWRFRASRSSPAPPPRAPSARACPRSGRAPPS
jgi:mannose-6-phosphate isomerase-like protein (cupin superfamily)